eukprot:scaffold24845_cov89-Phaeocystis_antarctica.AAC.1
MHSSAAQSASITPAASCTCTRTAAVIETMQGETFRKPAAGTTEFCHREQLAPSEQLVCGELKLAVALAKTFLSVGRGVVARARAPAT